jgi:hypothetical protein
MKPLNRPMFKYGGPIKEGIMSGMKDNKQAINTVGSPLAPKDETGRGGYALPLLGFLGGNVLRTAAMRAVPKIANLFRTQVGTKAVQKAGPTFTMPGVTKTMGAYSGKIPGKTITPGTAQVPVMGPTKLGSYFASDPLIATGSKVVQGLVSPTSKGIIQKGARIVLSPTGIATGLYYAGGKFFDQDGNEQPPPNEEVVLGDRVGTSGAPGGGDPDMFLTPRTKEDPKKTKSEENEALKQKYYKIMGLDKMKKDAVYDSLIDASRIVSEEGADLKGSLKSGTLQNKIIQAISGQLDKSAALKKQIDAAILKGEITKDIKANDPAEKNKARLVEKQIELADQKLSGGSLIENIEAGKKAAGGANSTANVYNSVLRTYKTEPEVLADTTEASKLRELDNYTTDAALVKTMVTEQNKGPGIYILDKTVVYIDEQGNASTLALG